MPYAIDLFCGAGGFSEGILQAEFDIVFSSDRSPMAQETYMNRHEQLGLIQGKDTYFELADIKDLSAEFIFEKINSLKYGPIFEPGKIDVIFGGPPCQGFSRLGKRDSSDPRNKLFHEYLRIIKEVKPKYVVMENVTGILDMQMLDFPSVLKEGYLYEGSNLVPFILRTELEGLGYKMLDVKVLNAANFGVPQQRNRAIFLAYRKDVCPIEYPKVEEKTVNVSDALGDLYETITDSSEFSKQALYGRTPSKITGKPLKRHKLTNMETSRHDKSIIERFSLYHEGENRRKALIRLRKEGIDLFNLSPNLFYETLFQVNSIDNFKIIKETLINFNLNNELNLTQLWLNHTSKQLATIKMIEENCIDNIELDLAIHHLSKRIKTTQSIAYEFWNQIRLKLNQTITAEKLHEMLIEGNINEEIADAIFTKKGIRTRLDSKSVSPTIVTLPDDFIHPYFNRVLTVREMARLQSFDDSFEFLGKRTTGGEMRAKETPQFTQVGNAVPPLLAKAIALEVFKSLKKTEIITE